MARTIGSTNLTPLSSAGLWLAVIMTPMTAFRFFDRAQAIMPTSVDDMIKARHCCKQKQSQLWTGYVCVHGAGRSQHG